MSIYSISAEIDNFMFFTLDDLDVCEKMEDFDIEGFGQPLKFSWVAPKAMFIESDSGAKVLPDITQWSGSDLVLSEKAKQILDEILKDSGDYYRLTGSCKGYWFFNPIIRLGNEIINLEQTTSSYFDDGSWDKLKNLVFKGDAEKIVPALFTLEIDRGVKLYCNSMLKEKIEINGLTGIAFFAKN
ncbi:MAG: hypothetical protein V4732_15225 [Pseudomonadota bacterium]